MRAPYTRISCTTFTDRRVNASEHGKQSNECVNKIRIDKRLGCQPAECLLGQPYSERRGSCHHDLVKMK